MILAYKVRATANFPNRKTPKNGVTKRVNHLLATSVLTRTSELPANFCSPGDFLNKCIRHRVTRMREYGFQCADVFPTVNAGKWRRRPLPVKTSRHPWWRRIVVAVAVVVAAATIEVVATAVTIKVATVVSRGLDEALTAVIAVRCRSASFVVILPTHAEYENVPAYFSIIANRSLISSCPRC